MIFVQILAVLGLFEILYLFAKRKALWIFSKFEVQPKNMNENDNKNLNEIRFEKVYKRLALIPTEIFAVYGGFIPTSWGCWEFGVEFILFMRNNKAVHGPYVSCWVRMDPDAWIKWIQSITENFDWLPSGSAGGHSRERFLVLQQST